MYTVYAHTRFGAADPWIRENRYADTSVQTTKVKTYGVDRTPKGLQNRAAGSGSDITTIINNKRWTIGGENNIHWYAWSQSEILSKTTAIPRVHEFGGL